MNNDGIESSTICELERRLSELELKVFEIHIDRLRQSKECEPVAKTYSSLWSLSLCVMLFAILTTFFTDGNSDSGMASAAPVQRTLLTTITDPLRITAEDEYVSPTQRTYSRFTSGAELREAVDAYLEDSANDTIVADTYGWPIGTWDTSQVADFRYVSSIFERVLLSLFLTLTGNSSLHAVRYFLVNEIGWQNHSTRI